ncbi:unnamed protein product (macronuclear) [Paramecium tetraurelia]|uniref:Uncharacterized protein n=1 Tax=Paramecium tetraurelia TaxID=5888 RepID=A0DKF5_PARTE|nr:uncharacterized protein GSPATT00017851001 [Paramecium tetraurelia]CAK83522.1 unnamed protein product [Paramecium tetraurelia]|eukprot:XP_001450919.1 hypothetical protein (macronuclear) [Paramecium tetraurelia strain d4-2]
MASSTISLSNVYQLSILMPRQQVNKLQMQNIKIIIRFLVILKQKLLKEVTNQQFIQKRMAMASLMRKHASQYQIN